MVYSLDISSSSPAFAKWSNDGELIDICYLTYTKKCRDLKVWTNVHIDKKDMFNGILVEDILKDKWLRLFYIWKRIEFFFEDIDVILIEGAAFAGVGRVADLANTTGAYIGNILSRANDNVKVVEYSPTEIKKDFSGYGGADKPAMRRVIQDNYKELDDMLMRIENEGGVMRYKTPLEDIVDSFAIGINYFNNKTKE